ncbi:hypothetical protein MJO28_003322 [Puccinia striiformis f. sp. tritici]|uniref:Uncharacterized protein n=1 Tax=Puccinia striiformis f. sp. tritici TaxID=168172 RepID=A0ACC0ES43_9BASI|nr:hypothetical protein MJO28_003322 [Puccinia striiformis f. sp. tritici]
MTRTRKSFFSLICRNMGGFGSRTKKWGTGSPIFASGLIRAGPASFKSARRRRRSSPDKQPKVVYIHTDKDQFSRIHTKPSSSSSQI